MPYRSKFFIALVVAASLPAIAAAQSQNVSQPIDDDRMPHRVHVFEDYETEIERRWWLCGEPSGENPPPSLSASLPNTRYCVAAETKNFDRKMEDQEKVWKAVIFNPVPGPPMAGNTRLRFRYKINGSPTLRVQIYSLTNNYHRYLTITDLPQGSWQQATVDMTAARRPDGSGGPLAADERIDDIQFYIPPEAELAIDDIVLYEAGGEEQQRKFPRRVIFTGWFDTGEQGKEWPGDFAIVLHEKPRTWDAARSIVDQATGMPQLNVGLRGWRPLGEKATLFFRYRLTGADKLAVALTNSRSGESWEESLTGPKVGQWSEATVTFDTSAGDEADTLRFHLPAGAELLVDDLLLYEP